MSSKIDSLEMKNNTKITSSAKKITPMVIERTLEKYHEQICIQVLESWKKWVRLSKTTLSELSQF